MISHLCDRLGKAALLALLLQILLGGGGAPNAWAVSLAAFLVAARLSAERGRDDAVAASFVTAMVAAAITIVLASLRGIQFDEIAYGALISMLAVSAFVEWLVLWQSGRADGSRRASA